MQEKVRRKTFELKGSSVGEHINTNTKGKTNAHQIVNSITSSFDKFDNISILRAVTSHLTW